MVCSGYDPTPGPRLDMWLRSSRQERCISRLMVIDSCVSRWPQPSQSKLTRWSRWWWKVGKSILHLKAYKGVSHFRAARRACEKNLPENEVIVKRGKQRKRQTESWLHHLGTMSKASDRAFSLIHTNDIFSIGVLSLQLVFLALVRDGVWVDNKFQP